jgi:hypothetical protein
LRDRIRNRWRDFRGQQGLRARVRTRWAHFVAEIKNKLRRKGQGESTKSNRGKESDAGAGNEIGEGSRSGREPPRVDTIADKREMKMPLFIRRDGDRVFAVSLLL